MLNVWIIDNLTWSTYRYLVVFSIFLYHDLLLIVFMCSTKIQTHFFEKIVDLIHELLLEITYAVSVTVFTNSL